MTYIDNARQALTDLDDAVMALRRRLGAVRSAGEARRRLEAATEDASGAVEQLHATLFILEQTGLDVVDLQGRLRKETRKLIDPLVEIDKVAATESRLVTALRTQLIAIEERAQLAAGALFPSAARGLDDANDLILFKLRPLVLPRYRREVERQQADGRWSTERSRVVDGAFRRMERLFQDVNGLLDQLATTTLTRSSVVGRVARLRERLADAGRELQAVRREPVFDGFGRLLGDVKRIALAMRRALTRIEVPVFPTWGRLGPLRHAIDAEMYDGLAGIQKFALLNIAARMQSIEVDGKRLLAPAFAPEIRIVFPDRIYLEADRALIDAVSRTVTVFKEAPAGLHRFNEGSYKQTTFDEGNLQLSYATKRAGRVDIDADIDLYRGPLKHLFGEVLVNHLTGSKTSQFKVHEILAEHEVPSIGSFDIVRTRRA